MNSNMLLWQPENDASSGVQEQDSWTQGCQVPESFKPKADSKPTKKEHTLAIFFLNKAMCAHLTWLKVLPSGGGDEQSQKLRAEIWLVLTCESHIWCQSVPIQRIAMQLLWYYRCQTPIITKSVLSSKSGKNKYTGSVKFTKFSFGVVSWTFFNLNQTCHIQVLYTGTTKTGLEKTI